MCGISGWFLRDSKCFELENIQKMVSALHHRGPDDSGIYYDQKKGIALGHNRLSIIDLSDNGHQPMINKKTGDILIFNGEIYNFKILRKELEGLGHDFFSQTDTEVLLYAFKEWGIECLSRIKGMFAFGFWSQDSHTLHLVRDPMGIKPLYFWQLPHNEGVVFASEVKAFLQLPGFKKDINRNSIEQFIEFGYTFNQSDTIFQNIQKLPPGHHLEIKQGKIGVPVRYFYPNLQTEPVSSGKVLENRLYENLVQVVKEQLVADVPVGLLLSGGLDSGIIAAIASRLTQIKTFSFGFAGSSVDERPYARIVSEYIGSDHEEILINTDEFMEDLEQNIRHFDDLFADWGTVSTHLIYKRCRERGVKVVIVGEGADELFAGYHGRFYPSLDINKAWSLDWRLFKLYRVYVGRRYGSQFWNYRKRMKEYMKLTKGDMFGAIRLFESRDQLPNNYIMKVDKASMAASVEARVPFLDSRIAEIAYQIHGDLLIDNKAVKILLSSMAKRFDLLPEKIIQRPKYGAGIAMSWMETSETFRSYARQIILAQDGWTDVLGLRKAMTEYFVHNKQGFPFPSAISIFRTLAWRLLILNLWSRFYKLSPDHD